MQSTYYYMRAEISPYDMLHARQYYKMDAERQNREGVCRATPLMVKAVRPQL